MKKIISILLVVITVFSLTAMMVSAEETTTQKPIKVTFYYDKVDTRGTVVYVDYNENINNVAPDYDDQKANGFIIKHIGWDTDLAGYEAETITLGNIPVIPENSRITEITFTGVWQEKPDNTETKVESAVDGILGEGTTLDISAFLERVISLLKNWVMSMTLFLKTFMPV